MKIGSSMILALVAITLTSCATSKPPPVFHNVNNNTLVIESLDANACQVLQPAGSGVTDNDSALAAAMDLPQHDEAVVILENYDETRFGAEFRERGTTWFVALRNLGYQHIVFLQGRGVADPEGLVSLVEYN